MRRRIFAFVLPLGFLAVIWLMAPLAVSAAVGDVFAVDGVTYKVLSETDDGEGSVQVGRGYPGTPAIDSVATSVTIPENVHRGDTIYDVVAIGDFAFYGLREITGAYLSDGLKSIGLDLSILWEVGNYNKGEVVVI